MFDLFHRYCDVSAAPGTLRPLSWAQGRLADELAAARKARRKLKGLDDEEALVLRWLESRKA
ncbi:hypothetical protein [Mesorhizobium sp. KR9-304]|uniref:hypothetical protein n=1 Tax=Mesorhizobium sp. KR9-304 TaxID=3156614 RepID=UPI0032B458AC